MNRKLTFAAAALVATLSVGFASTEATAQDLGGFLRIGNGGTTIGFGFGHDDSCNQRRFHTHPRYEIVKERVWREGYWKSIEVPAVYRTIDRRNGPDLVILVRPARCERVFVPGYWEIVERRVLVGETRCWDDHGRRDHDRGRDYDRGRDHDRGRDYDRDRRDDRRRDDDRRDRR